MAEKSVITSLAVVIAIMSIIVVSLLFYAFCFKSPSKRFKIKSKLAKRSITVEPAADDLSTRRPTLLPEVQKTIAEEARDASVKQKIRRNNSIKKQKKDKKDGGNESTNENIYMSDDQTVFEHPIEQEKIIMMETTAQVHAEAEAPAMEVKIEELPTEVKVDVEISEDEASNLRFANLVSPDTPEEQEKKRKSSRIPVPIHSRSNSGDSFNKSKEEPHKK